MLLWIQQNPAIASAFFAAIWIVIPSLAQLGVDKLDKTTAGHAFLTVLAGYGINLPQVLDGLKRLMAKALGIAIAMLILIGFSSTVYARPATPYRCSARMSPTYVVAWRAAAAARVVFAALLMLVALSVGVSGCMVALPQPGQTPAQVQACSTDATLHNILLYTSGGLTTTAGVEASVASQTPSASQGLAIAGAITAGAAALALGGSTFVANTYNADGCAPTLPAGTKQAGR